jgi:phage tail protein X
MADATILTETVGVQGLTLAAAIWRKFKKQPQGFLEKVLDLNPGLSGSDILAVGTVINFPLEELTAPAGKDPNVVRLWD